MLLGLLSLLAFAPTDDQGIEPVRVRRTDPIEQVRLARSAAWQRFTRENPGWRARFDEATGTPHRMWGSADIGPTGNAAQVEAGILRFVAEHADLVGATPRDLRPRSSGFARDTWYVDLDVLIDGLPVWRGGVTARVKHGRLVMLGADTYPGVPLEGADRTGLSAAIDAALDRVPGAHTDVEAERIALPLDTDHGLVLRRAWIVRSATSEPPGRWVTFVDAETGGVIGAYNEVRFAGVTATHDARYPGGELATSALPWARISNGTDTVNADADGQFVLDGDPLVTWLEGSHVTVRNAAGDEGELWFSGDAHWTEADATMAELDAYVHVEHMLDWRDVVAPDVRWSTVRANVNLDETCNAYYDGAVNFFKAGSGCNNTGRLADVIFHEWGHGFHEHSLLAGSFDGSLSEGAADVAAFLQTGDHVIAPYFQTNGKGIRDVAPDKRYPDDYVANEQYVHSNGLIFGGAMWDLWGALVETHGAEAGTRRTEEIFTGLLKGGPDIESSFDEAYVAADDDGDLANGTPDECALLSVFGEHGLGPIGGGSPLVAVHDPRGVVSGAIDHPIGLQLENVAPACFDFAATDAWVTWRVDGGAWQETPLSVGAGGVAGSIPRHEPGAFVEYWITVVDDQGGETTAPAGAHVNPFSFYVGDVIPVHCDDFEGSDGGWTHELLSGKAAEGADDWTWGVPRGHAGDPSRAASGNRVWGNDLGGGNSNGEYQNDKKNRLTSPPLATKHYTGVFLEYARWLTVEDGLYDHARVLADDEVVWTNWATAASGEEHHTDRQWTPHAIDLGGRADDGSVTVAFELESDQGLAFGGWTVDDVCLYAPATADNRLGISDLVVERIETGVRVAFTNPGHAPLERVVVVRGRKGFPAGPHDGDIVWDDEDPTLGTPVHFLDDARSAAFYAAYAFDGREWSRFTLEGLNAGRTERSGGCSTAPSAPAGWAGAIAAAIALARRRARR